ncbi:MAG: hypothetical protein LBE55_05705 [Clostridiales bacterium]|jgi:hypothetical protein|nr:hypothetical protein [Clostridiales bacterium]
MNNTPYQPHGMPPFAAKAPGKNFLMVTGILFIIFNAIGFFMTLSTIMTVDVWLWMFGGHAMRGTWMMIYGLSLLLSLLAVALGIMGVSLCNKIQHGGMLLVVAIILMVASILYNIIYTALIFNFDGLMGVGAIIGIPIGLVLPILFIIGAVKNKKAADAAPYEHRRGY